MPKNLFDYSVKTHEVADAVFDSLLTSNDLVPSQWAGMLGQRVENGELHLLWGVFFSAWQDLASPRDRIRSEAASFFTRPDAGEPVSLRFLCEALELNLNAVQEMARARIATGARQGARPRRNAYRSGHISVLS
jgi:hypothetical protein